MGRKVVQIVKSMLSDAYYSLDLLRGKGVALDRDAQREDRTTILFLVSIRT